MIQVINGFGAGAISRHATQKAWLTKMRGKKMIDEYWTWIFYGYHSDELKPYSHKPIVARCDDCCQYRVLKKSDYRDLCLQCVRNSKYITARHRKKLSDSGKGRKRPPRSGGWCNNISKSKKGKKLGPLTKEHKQNISNGNKGKPGNIYTTEDRQRISARMQDIPYEEWTGFAPHAEYCHLFDEDCRERIRKKYGYKCFICNKPQKEDITKLCVHHVDMNKDQGCNDNKWKLVPLCRQCHGMTHTRVWQRRIEYLLENDIIIQ